MKNKCAAFLRGSVRVSMPVLAAVCFSAAGLTAAAENTQKQKNPDQMMKQPSAAKTVLPEKPKAPSFAEQAAAMRGQKETVILQKLAEAEKLASLKQYLKAIQLLNETEALFQAEKCPGKDGKKYLPLYLQIAEKRFMADMENCRVILGEQKFQEAKKLYAKALRSGFSPESARLFAQVKTLASEAKVLYYTGTAPGQKILAEGSLDELVKDVPDFSIRVAHLIDSCNQMIRACEFREKTDLDAIDPNYDNRQREIEVLYTRGEKLYREQRYTNARDQLEKVLVLDPNHQNTIRLLDKIYKKLYFYAELRQYNELLRNDAETIWSWSQGIPADRSNAQITPIARPVSSSSPLLNKISSWRKISIDIKDYDVLSAIDLIREKSREADPEGRGFSFIPKNLDKEKMTNRTVSLQLDNIPIEEVLRYFCQKAGIRYKFQNDMIVIGNDIDEYETRFIPIKYSIIQQIVEKSGGEEDTSSSGEKGGVWGGEGGIGSALSEKERKRNFATTQALKAYFAERGIPFEGKEATITYDRRSNKLTVKNTSEQLRKLEMLIRELDIDNPLVLIESKLLEINMKDAEELGFDWLLTQTITDNPDGTGLPKKWTSTYSMNSPLRSSGLTDNLLVNNLNLIPNFNLGGKSDLNLYLTVTAVDRTDRVETLFTPKVIATSGSEATIKMVRQMYFPESWAEPDTSNVNGTSFEFQPSYPEFGEATDVGISFTVTPTVNTNAHTISLSLQPTVTDLTGWSDYSYDIVMEMVPEGGGGATPPVKPPSPSREIASHIKEVMPEISVREVVTNVKVYDGQTLMIGGMMIDKHSTMDDRFPLLGDIPLVGRLFSKYSSKIERANLIISVTTRLISKDGIPIQTNQNNGLPDFRR